MMKILVTGAAGFIGSHLVRRMLELGYAVRALDDFSTGRPENLIGLLPDIELYEADLSIPEVCMQATKGVHAVLHHAAIASVQRSLARPDEAHRVNVNATFHLLEACRKNQVQRLVYASSSSVYGDAPEMPKTESMQPKPQSMYAIQKHISEQYAAFYHHFYGVESVSLRYFNVFGPRQDPQGDYAAVLPKFLAQMQKRRPPTIYGDGLTSRDFVYIKDVVEANILALSEPSAAGKVFNIGSGQSISLLQLVECLNQLLGSALIPLHEAEKPGDIRHSLADISQARTILGYQPKWSLQEGLSEMVPS